MYMGRFVFGPCSVDLYVYPCTKTTCVGYSVLKSGGHKYSVLFKLRKNLIIKYLFSGRLKVEVKKNSYL